MITIQIKVHEDWSRINFKYQGKDGKKYYLGTLAPELDDVDGFLDKLKGDNWIIKDERSTAPELRGVK